MTYVLQKKEEEELLYEIRNLKRKIEIAELAYKKAFKSLGMKWLSYEINNNIKINVLILLLYIDFHLLPTPRFPPLLLLAATPTFYLLALLT